MSQFSTRLSQEGSRLARLAANESENDGLKSVARDGNTKTERGPVDNILILLSKDAEQVPGQHQRTGNIASLVLDITNDSCTNKDQASDGQDDLES